MDSRQKPLTPQSQPAFSRWVEGPEKESSMRWFTLLLIAAIVVTVEWLAGTRLHIPNPGAILLVGVILTGYTGGLAFGLLVSCFLVAYLSYFYLPRGDFSIQDPEDVRRTLVWGFAAVVCALVSAQLRSVRRQLSNRRREMEQLAEELRKKNEELRELYEVKTNFVSTVSHELRTPLTVISAAANNLIDGVFGNVSDVQNKWLQKVKLNAGVLDGMIGQLLEIARFEAGKTILRFESANLTALAENAVDSFWGVAQEKGLDLRVVPGPDAPNVMGDRGLLQRLLDNLISNAVKFTPRGGAIAVSVAEGPAGVEVSVLDNGPGIAAEYHRAIFERFRQVHPEANTSGSPQGIGLGLAICKDIVEQHGGRIWVESEPGKGSHFKFNIPAAHPADASESASALRN